MQAFVPRMLAAKEPGHIVNTASLAGLSSVPSSGVYCVSKHGVVTLSECLYHELRAANAPIGVTCLCPAFFKTGIANSERNRPPEAGATNPEGAAYAKFLSAAVEAGRIPAEAIAQMALDAVREGRFYVLPHQKSKGQVEARMQDILQERLPTNPFEV